VTGFCIYAPVAHVAPATHTAVTVRECGHSVQESHRFPRRLDPLCDEHARLTHVGARPANATICPDCGEKTFLIVTAVAANQGESS
jgi:hypothetical protein